MSKINEFDFEISLARVQPDLSIVTLVHPCSIAQLPQAVGNWSSSAFLQVIRLKSETSREKDRVPMVTMRQM